MMPSSGFKRNTSLLAKVESGAVFAGTIFVGSFILSIPLSLFASRRAEGGHKKYIRKPLNPHAIIGLISDPGKPEKQGGQNWQGSHACQDGTLGFRVLELFADRPALFRTGFFQ